MVKDQASTPKEKVMQCKKKKTAIHLRESSVKQTKIRKNQARMFLKEHNFRDGSKFLAQLNEKIIEAKRSALSSAIKTLSTIKHFLISKYQNIEFLKNRLHVHKGSENYSVFTYALNGMKRLVKLLEQLFYDQQMWVKKKREELVLLLKQA